MKKLLLSLLCVSFTFTVYSQSIAERYIGSRGVSYFTDYFMTPVSSALDENYSGTPYMAYTAATELSFMTIMYTGRFNLTEPSDNFAISASLTPSLGITISEIGLGSFNIPFTINTEFGAGSTYHTSRNMGFTFGLGVEYTKLGLFGGSYDSTFPKLQDSWVQPVMETGIRFWNKKNKMREINIKVGMGGARDYREYETEELSKRRSLTARLAFKNFLNY